MRTLLARFLLLAVLTSLIAGVGGSGLAAAQSLGPSSPAAPLPQTVPEDTTTTTTTTDNGGLKRWQETLMFLAGVALIGGIGFAIVRDARKVAPVTEDEQRGAHQTTSSGAHKAQHKAKARKKAKAAKAARRHNR